MAEGAEDPAREGMEHLQNAAREVIRATRKFLDAAEQLVDDPGAVQTVLTTFTSVAQVASQRLRSDGAPDAGENDPDGGRVQRIKIS